MQTVHDISVQILRQFTCVVTRHFNSPLGAGLDVNHSLYSSSNALEVDEGSRMTKNETMISS